MALVLLEQLARLRVPQPRRLIVTCGRQPRPVWAERHAAEGGGMALVLPEELARLRVPQSRRLIAARGRQPRPVPG